MTKADDQKPAAVTQVTPEKRITIGEKDYTLRADMGVLKTLQQEFSQDVYELALATGIPAMRFDQLARVIWIAIGEGSPGLDALEQHIVRERGLAESKYFLLEWLIGAVSTDTDRKKNVEDVQKMTQAMRQATAAAKKR